MKGKILISILALGASSVALANGGLAPAPNAAPDYFDGFVLGLDGSVQHLVGNVKDSASPAYDMIVNTVDEEEENFFMAHFSSEPISFKSDVGDNVLGLGVFAGYGKVLNSNYYVGGELYGRYAHNTINATTISEAAFVVDEYIAPEPPPPGPLFSNKFSTSINVDSDWSFGGALKLGYLVTPKTMIYLLAGVENSRFNVDVNHTVYDSLFFENQYFDWSASYSFNENRWAFVPGVGIETMLNDKFSLKAEYTYAAYGSFSHHNNSSINETYSETVDDAELFASFTSTMSSDDTVDLNRGLFTLGLAYHFNGI